MDTLSRIFLAQDRKEVDRVVQLSKACQKLLLSEQRNQKKTMVEPAKTATGVMKILGVRRPGRGTISNSGICTRRGRRQDRLSRQSKLLKQPQVPRFLPLNPWSNWRLMEAVRSELSVALGAEVLNGRGIFPREPKFLGVGG